MAGTNSNTFLKISRIAQTIRETRSHNARISICAGYFISLEQDADLNLAAQFLGEGAFSSNSGKRAATGSRTTSTLAAEICEIDYEKVFKPCRTATGSSSETIEKLFRNIPEARSKWSGAKLSLQNIMEVYEALAELSTRDDKQALLKNTWLQMTPLEVKYFIRIMSQGSLRIGFETKSVVRAVAKAFNKKAEEVRYAHMITGSLGKTAVLARNNSLDEATFNLFHPISFMLASPIENRPVNDYSQYIAEEKFDGMRCQAHISGNEIKLFSRALNDVTATFPDIVQFFRKKELPNLVLDGEICVFKDKTILPFQLLQKRMGLKKPTNKILQEYPVLFISYDLLYLQNEPVFHKTLLERRRLLNSLSEYHHLPLTTQKEVQNRDHIQQLFEQALNHGNEGLMLKRKDSVYEYGQRCKSWLKVKEPGGSLDTVIMYAHAGSAKRGGTYSDFTLGISVKEDERYEEEFIPIGKAFGGYTDEELKKLNQKIKELTVERYGPTLGLLPGIVAELEFDDIQVNKRTKANYTLRFPRFRSIRWDLSPSDTNTLKDVELMYEEKLNKERKTQDKDPSFYFPEGEPKI